MAELSFCLYLHVWFSEHLCASELRGRRTSLSSGEKIVSDLQTRQTAYSKDRSRVCEREESEPDPDRDIELELCALDMEDSDPQEIKSQVDNVDQTRVILTALTSALLQCKTL